MEFIFKSLFQAVQDHALLLVLFFTICALFTLFTLCHALLRVHTPQGATAWIIVIVVQPLMVLAYWMFGQRKYTGYVEKLKAALDKHRKFFDKRNRRIAECSDTTIDPAWQQLNAFSWDPFLKGNKVKLLNDSDEAYPVMLDAIAGAKTSIFMEFYIFRSDYTGEKFLNALLAKAHEGVKIYILYDSFSSDISDKWCETLINNGVRLCEFKPAKTRHNFFRVNFRNHRKILVIDQNAIGMTGGLNIAQEYESKGKLGHWRDSFIRVEGPAVHALQTIFLADWMWATNEIIILPNENPTQNFTIETDDPASVLVFPNGPADEQENATMMFTTAIRNAKKSIRITTPYLIPDQPLLTAIKAAALCGISVQIIIPDKADHLHTWLAAFSYADELRSAGATVKRYADGFIHQKLVIIDDQYTIIGTNNIDNRSLHLNFEISLLVKNTNLANDAIRQFNIDLSRCCDSTNADQIKRTNILWRIAINLLRLVAPVL